MQEALARDFRANPAWELVLFDRLPAAEQALLAELAREAGFYGILRRRGADGARAKSAKSAKSIDCDTALLLLTLREPGPLPAYLRSLLGEALPRVVGRLVSDGILEVAQDGGWVSGAAALSLFASGGGEGEGRLARLSLAALRYGQELPVDDADLLSWRIYSYNRLPLAPRWQRLVPDGPAVEEHLGIAKGGRHRKLLERSWERLPLDGWLCWQARRRAGDGAGPGRSGGPTWKLYVSPRPEVLAAEFGAILAALEAARAEQFKIGEGAAGLLRPDKIVAYFPSFERLAAAADSTVRRLAGAPVHGVPFTAEMGGDGLLSWGVDPPRRESIWSAGAQESWRLWVTNLLARALLAARAESGAAAEPWRFALERVRLEGVDTATWTPGAALWKEP